jgi:hypothetical protein
MQVLTLNLDANLLPKVRFLSEELGIAHDVLGKVMHALTYADVC